jgi:small-conductance mechanosensitive channel
MRSSFFVVLLLSALGTAELALAQEAAVKARAAADSNPDKVVLRATVEIDGTTLFRIAGAPAFPAAERAAAIVARIETAAADATIKSEQIHNVDDELGTYVVAGNINLMLVTDDDASLEGLGRKVIAEIYATRVRTAIDGWRADRTAKAIEKSVLLSLAASLVFALVVVVVFWLARWARAALNRYRARIHSVGIQSFQVVRAERIQEALLHVLNVVITLIMAALIFFFLDYVLRLFPWTRGISIRLLDYVLDPLFVLGRGLVAELPSMIFLAVLFVLTRWLLKVIYLFFGAIRRAEVTIEGFDSDWAEPTYKIVRVLVMAFAVVIAYPYIPGSSSEAFKGISLFIGVVFSLGSSSIVANTLAGYLMTYRRVFKIGDRVKIGNVTGDVSEVRVQVTHLRTIKNEEVTIPNSTILNSEVVNYSVLAKTKGLILHTTVGIGYETPWRQVEAMLLESARRTKGLMQEPSPFIRQLALADFAVTYELNVHCDNVQIIGEAYTDLHRNILDVFNEYGVQIMTPAYEGDPPEPKVVPKEGWFASPAKPEPK